MPLPLDTQTFAGPHPTCREFVAQLLRWGFTERKEDHVHTVFRGPRGGTLRVLRSRLGRIDPALVDKAARLAGITPEHFWAGPDSPEPEQQSSGPTTPGEGRPAAPRRDTAVSLVLALHAEADRPLGFDQVVEASSDQLTRSQVRAASAALCRYGHLDRIRPGVYQWTGGRRAALQDSEPRRSEAPHPRAAEYEGTRDASASATEIFSQLFPSGVQMTGELLADLQQWAQLTDKLTGRNRCSEDRASDF